MSESGHATDTREAARRLRAYNASGARRIGGWFSRIDAEIFSTLLLAQTAQGIRGATGEIGVHHGKSFIPLCLALAEGERAICIDVFDDQSLNVDNSGEGSLALLRRNLARTGVDADRVEIVRASSLDFPFQAILDKVGPLRFISIDGGHWAEIVCNDLALARNCAADGQIIALDDFFDVDWPGVTVGLFDWHASRGADYAPFALTASKLYLCHKSHVDAYQSCLNSRYFAYNTRKTVELLGREIPVLNGPVPTIRGKLAAYLRTYHPGLNNLVRERLGRTGSRAGHR